MSEFPIYKTMLDGRNASAEDLAPLAFSGFAHFTAMQIRSGHVRGLDLHLKRLRSASQAMFGETHSDSEILSFLRAAINGSPADISLTLTVFPHSGEFSPHSKRSDLGVLVRTSSPSDGPAGPLKLTTVRHERPLASLKHVGEATKTYYLRKAVASGFDDAAFMDASGHLSEATIWNLAFWDGESVVWPEADMLQGITMQIVRRHLEKHGIPEKVIPITQETIEQFSGGAVMNSWTAGVAIRAIGSEQLNTSDTLVHLLHRAYQLEIPTEI